MLVEARSIAAGGADKKFRRSSMMRASSSGAALDARPRNKPSAPKLAAKADGGSKKASLSDSLKEVDPSLLIFSMSLDTIECPKRKAAPANSSVILGSTDGS